MKDIIRLKLGDALSMPFPELTKREVNLPAIKDKAHAIIGMRRAGKTYYLFQCLRERLRQGIDRDRLIYFNFEDERLAGIKAIDLGILIEEYYRQFPDYRRKKKVCFCFDEIQLVSGWEKFIRRLLDEEEVELFLSGSSAKLLSREIATSMRGRAMETVVSPFSFREFLSYRGFELPQGPALIDSATRSKILHAFDDYMRTGGFPEAQELTDRDRVQLLQSYVEVVVFRDVVERYNITNISALRALVRKFLCHYSSLLSITKIYNDFRSQGIEVSKSSLFEFTAHLQDSFLIDLLEIYSNSERKRRVNPRKIYPRDHALVRSFLPSATFDEGRLLEGVVACELQRSSQMVSYYKTRSGYEIDFLVYDYNGNMSLYQVAATIENEETCKREVRALLEASEEYPEAHLFLLTKDLEALPKQAVPSKIQIFPIWEWLLQK